MTARQLRAYNAKPIAVHDHVTSIGATYDEIATDYDARWSVHVEAPQRRLTRELALARGERCVDLGCGTGVDTVDMLRHVAPGEVWAVDPSAAMLQSAARRAARYGLSLVTRCQGADDFVRNHDETSFDVVSLRFCLGYLEAAPTLQRMPRLLRAGGRIGILTILASSAPQAYATYQEMAEARGLAAIPMTAQACTDEIASELEMGGAHVESCWEHRFRLCFETGTGLACWLRTCGIATSPLLSALPLEVQDELWDEFAQRVEARREADGIPLDFEIAGMVASSR